MKIILRCHLEYLTGKIQVAKQKPKQNVKATIQNNSPTDKH